MFCALTFLTILSEDWLLPHNISLLHAELIRLESKSESVTAVKISMVIFWVAFPPGNRLWTVNIPWDFAYRTK
jgi:hypothetical protein